MASLVDVCRFNPTAGGTTDWTYSSAVTGYQSPTAANAITGNTYRYRAESSDLTQWEVGYGVWNGTVLARTTVLFNSSGTTAKINFSTTPQVAMVLLAEDIREKLDAARTYYVLTTGSDSNNGLANTAGGAFLTIQKAIDTIATLDINGQTVTVQVGDGTYTGANTLKNAIGFATSGNLVIQGNNATPANVVISTTSANAFLADGLSVVWDIKDLKIQTTTSGTGIIVKNGATVRYGNLNFGACAINHTQIFSGGRLIQLSSYAISGGATYHWQVYDDGVVVCTSSTITLTGTPAFTYFIQAGTLGLFDGSAITFSGSATGTRYNVYGNSVIFTNGAGANYFPGSIAGTTATGGQYI